MNDDMNNSGNPVAVLDIDGRTPLAAHLVAATDASSRTGRAGGKLRFDHMEPADQAAELAGIKASAKAATAHRRLMRHGDWVHRLWLRFVESGLGFDLPYRRIFAWVCAINGSHEPWSEQPWKHEYCLTCGRILWEASRDGDRAAHRARQRASRSSRLLDRVGL